MYLSSLGHFTIRIFLTILWTGSFGNFFFFFFFPASRSLIDALVQTLTGREGSRLNRESVILTYQKPRMSSWRNIPVKALKVLVDSYGLNITQCWYKIQQWISVMPSLCVHVSDWTGKRKTEPPWYSPDNFGSGEFFFTWVSSHSNSVHSRERLWFH